MTFALRNSDYLCNITVQYNQTLQSLSFQQPINVSSFYWLSAAVSFAFTREPIHCVTMSGRRFNCELSSHCEIQLPCRLYSRISPARVAHRWNGAYKTPRCPTHIHTIFRVFMIEFDLLNTHFIITRTRYAYITVYIIYKTLEMRIKAISRRDEVFFILLSIVLKI